MNPFDELKSWIKKHYATKDYVSEQISAVDTSGGVKSVNGQTGDVVIDIPEVPEQKVLVLTEDMVTVDKDSTKGTSPYSTSYGYTNITVNDLIEDDLSEGVVIYPAIVSTMVVASAYRNVRIRFGESGSWHPVMNTTSILAGNSYFTVSSTRLYCYRTSVRSEGAFHMVTDSNTTYAVMTAAAATAGTETTARLISAKILNDRLTEVLTPKLDKPTLLWTNSDPTATYAAQTVDVDLSGYTFVIVMCMFGSSYQYVVSTITPVGETGRIQINGNTTNQGYRMFTVSTTGIEFQDAYYGSSSGNNGYAIPYKVYGVA